MGSNPHRHCSVPHRRYDFVDSSFAWFLSGQTCSRMGGLRSRSGRGVPDNLLLLRLHSPLPNGFGQCDWFSRRFRGPTAVHRSQALLGIADHFYCLNNGPAAAPLYARAEQLFLERGDAKELDAKVGRLRSEAERTSFVDLSRFLNEQLQNPIVQSDKKLRLWCLIAKGSTDIEIEGKARALVAIGKPEEAKAVQSPGDPPPGPEDINEVLSC